MFQTPPASLKPGASASVPSLGSTTPVTPAAQTSPSSPQLPKRPVQLGGRDIPLPGSRPGQSSALSSPSPTAKPPVKPIEVKQPTAPLPQAGNMSPQDKPTDKALGVNPALAPKPAQSSLTSATPPAAAGSQPPKPPRIPQTPTQPGVKQPIFAQIQANPKKWITIILGAILGLGLIILLLTRIFGRSGTPVQQGGGATPTPAQQKVLTYWGLWEPSSVLEEVIADYEAANPGVKIDYRVQSHKDYRERLQTAIASGNGPDIFRYHASWVPMLKADLAVLPSSVMNANEFQSTFYPIAAVQLQVDGKLVGLPIMYDGLVLYYNKDILQTAGVEPPATWAELKQLANELTVPADKAERRSSGIQRAGLAIGNTSNVDHFADILALLILQNGGDPAEPAFTEVRDALTFYTNFVAEDSVWSSALPNSTVAFARGDAAMMFAPSWRAHEILELNPSLNFATAPLPQLSEEVVTWGSYWAEGVNEKSAYKPEAWSFLKYLTSAEVMKKLYSAQSQVRAFGEPYSRTDLVADLQGDPYVGAVLKDAPHAQGWYLSSATHDNGINDNIIDYYRVAVEAVLTGEEMEKVLTTLDQGVTQVLRQYGEVK
ncbi:MAG: extracellular solute-binding protein [Parcubacteria group bacterium GW2011_GWB1_49_7]|nr:MAG: extracellular solute-binding protein [Candidatus Pacebacteria bacterium GW2011_GWA1_46_10]KKW09955.1 MAG: extracellular solute-binding protein [Parcubacteria group bacterium GW2011_GWB1_49_7]